MNGRPVDKVSLDDMPLNKFHIKMTALTLGAHLADGYSLATISTVLAAKTEILGNDPFLQGLLGSSAFMGILIGSIISGLLSDKLGRQKIFKFSFLLIFLASTAQFFVGDAIQLFCLRVIVGVGIGGDYAVGVTLLAEFVPKRHRGLLTACLGAVWTIGYVAANILGFALIGSEAWRLLLASAAVPAIVVLILRVGTPESPRWLIKNGKHEQAQQIVTKFFGSNVYVDEEEASDAGIMTLFSPRYRLPTIFVSLYFVLNVTPYFAIYTFLPTLLAAFGMPNDFTADLFLNLTLLGGSLLGTWFAAFISRRQQSIGSFAIAALALFALALVPVSAKIFLIISFAAFTIAITVNGALATVLPSECLPTKVRASANGFAVAASRLASALATFLLPLSLNSFGTSMTMIALGLVCGFGVIMCWAWASNTEKLPLSEASLAGKESSINRR